MTRDERFQEGINSMRRTLMFWIGVAASFGLPYTYFNPDVRESAQVYFNQAQSYIPGASEAGKEKAAAPAASIPGENSAANSAAAVAASPSTTGPPLSAPVFQEFAHVFSFHATPSWIFQTWPRVSTTLSDLRMEGLRVPLVSGSHVDDVAGSLTYYFDHEKTLQRITFQGVTGDERRLVEMLQREFKFQSEPSAAGGLYLVKWNGKPVSVLRVEPAPVVSANQPHTRLKIDLEINRPSRYYNLSPEMAALIERDKHAGRWGFK